MISYLKGKIIFKKEKFIILDVNNIGFKIFVSQKTLDKLNENTNAEIFCYLNVKENALDLYGFLYLEELNLFEIVNNIPGVGPKIATEIASFKTLEELKKRIEEKGAKAFEGIPGIGRKKAQTIILEISGIMKEISKQKNEEKKDEEVEKALKNLGFSRNQIKEALSKIPQNINTEEKIKEALKILGK